MDFSLLMNAGRIVVNTPTSQGAVGGTYNMLAPSLTLGCGTGGKNITTENITAKHLLNIQRICRKKINEKWFNVKPELFLDENAGTEIFNKEYYKNY
jgi:acetaldehyde dehydrogenase/alcohol dehydrogenase